MSLSTKPLFKPSMLLLEAILSFFIICSVLIFSTLFYKQIIKTDSEAFELALIQSDLFATKLFIEKELNSGKILEVNQDSIRFYAFYKQEFLQNFYSGYIDLSKSFASKAYTPNSKLLSFTPYAILFNNSELYELKKPLENNILLFKNSSPKRVFQRYDMVKNISTFSFSNSSLYLNNELLQSGVSLFKANMVNDSLQINICLENICQDWIFR